MPAVSPANMIDQRVCSLFLIGEFFWSERASWHEVLLRLLVRSLSQGLTGVPLRALA